MGSTTHIMAITLCVLMAPAAGFAGQQQQGEQKQPGERGGGSQPRRVSAEHDALSNADYTAALDGNGNALFTVKAGDFLLEKAVDSSGMFSLRLTQAKDVVTVVRDQAGYLARRGERSARFDPRSDTQGEGRDAVRATLLGSQAVRSFRRLSLLLENRDEKDSESPVMLSTLLDGALVQMLDGDPGAMPRIAKRVVRKQRARLQTVKFLPGDMFKDCVGMYEVSLLDSWNQYQSCMEWAANVHWWFQTWAEDWCHWEWLARSQQYLWQFVSCFALPI
jgi:hypothetical protein